MVKWNSVCSSVHGVMSELLLAAELGALSKADFSKLTTKLYTQLCCFPVCIVSWLASYTHFGEGGRDGGRAGDGVTPFQVQDIVFFQGWHCFAGHRSVSGCHGRHGRWGESAIFPAKKHDDGQHCKKVLLFFQSVIKIQDNIVGLRMKQEMVRGGLSTSVESGWGGGPRDSLALEAEFAALWSDTWARGRLDIIGTRQMARLLQVFEIVVRI